MNHSLNLKANKVILISSTQYSTEHDEILKSLIKRKIVLFCAVGVDCENWEEALDWLCIGKNGEGTHIINTTSHPGETLEEVKDFAKAWETEDESDIQIIEI